VKRHFFHGFRVGGLRRRAAPPVATARRPAGAFRDDQSPAAPSSICMADASASALLPNII